MALEFDMIDLHKTFTSPVPVYLSSMRRETTAEEEVDLLAGRLAETGARADPNSAYMLHFAALVPNLGPYQEYRAKPQPKDWWHCPAFEVREGLLPVPVAPGWGVEYDPALLREAEIV